MATATRTAPKATTRKAKAAARPKPARKAAAAKPAKPAARAATAKPGRRSPVGAAAGTDAGGTMMAVRHGALVRSALNPRKSFAPDDIAALAESIAQQGLLQNLVARPRGRGRYEITAGERRHRAIGILIADGRWPAGRTLPVLVRAFDDRAALQVAIIENIKRRDLEPMEEARGFVDLKAMGLGTDEIAAQVAMSRRHVQERIALVEKLAPKAQAALEAGEISIAQARQIKLADPARQDEILDHIAEDKASPWGEDWTADQIRQFMLEDLPRVQWAIFPLDLYDGAFVGEPEDDDRCFADPGRFERLQRAAIAEKVEALRAKWAFVEVLGEGKYFSAWQYEKEQDRTRAGAVVVVDRSLRSIEIHEGYVAKAGDDGRAKAAGGAAAAKPDFTRKHLFEAHKIKSAALQRAVAGDLRMAKVMTCFALVMASQSVAAMRTERVGPDERTLDARVAATLDRLRTVMGVSLFDKVGDGDRALCLDYRNDDDDAGLTIYRAIRSLADADLDALFAALVASRVGSFCGYEPRLGDDPVAVAMAEDLGLDMSEALPLPDTYLKLMGKERLGEMLIAIGWKFAETLKPTRAVLAARVQEDAANVLPRELRFGTTKDLEKAAAVVVPEAQSADVAAAAE